MGMSTVVPDNEVWRYRVEYSRELSLVNYGALRCFESNVVIKLRTDILTK